jgi:hypothetical protein
VRRRISSSSLRAVCKGSIWSILVSGIATVINLSVLLILKGEHGIECLLCCSIDVLVNTLVLAIVTDARGEEASFPGIYGPGSTKDHDHDSDAAGITTTLDKNVWSGTEGNARAKVNEHVNTPGVDDGKIQQEA